MSQTILTSVQAALSIWEIWICYQLLYTVILEKEYMSRSDKWISWGNIVVVGILLHINRVILFFSIYSLLMCCAITFCCVWLIKRKKVFLIINITILYFVFVALLDLFGIFLSMEFLGAKFVEMIYANAMSWEKEIIFFCARLAVYICILVLRRKIKDIRSVTEEFRYVILGVACALCILLGRYEYVLGDMASGGRTLEGAMTSLMLMIVSVGVISAGIFAVKYRSVKREKESLLLRDQMLEKQYAEMVKSRQMVHDMKNHLIALKQYEAEKQWDKLHDYLEEIGEELFRNSVNPWTGNQMMDLILNQKRQECEAKNISMEIDTEMFSYLPFSDREIISLLGNLLDNAIEACEKMDRKGRWIHIKIKMQNQMFYLEIENSIEEHPKEKNGHLISTKAEKSIKGYGLKNVKQIVDKYNGSFIYRIKEESFFVSLSFFDICNNQNEDGKTDDVRKEESV